MYDDSIMTRSLVQDFSLVCDREGLRTLVNISYMMGDMTLTLTIIITSPVPCPPPRSAGGRAPVWLDI